MKELDNKGLLKRNFDRPPLKDTVTVPAGGYTVIRFHANNPGIWMFHCHLEFHSEIGMSLLIKVGQQKDFPKEPNGWPKCGSYYNKDSFDFETDSVSNIKINLFLFFSSLTLFSFHSISTKIF